jgi:UDP-N-acetylmuramoylalanine--D-glutamate ligase
MLPISAERAVEGGVSAAGGLLRDAISKQPIEVLDLKSVAHLPGKHNWQNAAASYAVTRALGLGIDEVVAGLRSYPGLAHRQELVAVIDGIRFVNDSKATNADAAAKALACYENIYWIAGGRAKEGGLAGLEAYYPRVRRAYLIGEAAEAFAVQLGKAVATRRCGTLDKAVAAAGADARADSAKTPVVLLAPACASFDQYPNFEVRGEHFKTLVAQLAARPGQTVAPRGAA